MCTKIKRFIALVLTVSLMMCNLNITVSAKAKKVQVTSLKNVTPQFNTLTIKKGNSFKLRYKALPAKATNKKLLFKSSNKKVVTVSNSGKLIGRKKGHANIIIMSKSNPNVKRKLKVTVGVPVKKIAITNNTLKIIVGKTKNLKKLCKVQPSKASNKKVVYVSQNKKIAKVTKDGKLTAIKSGNCKIKVIAKDGNNVYSFIYVTVIPKKDFSQQEEQINKGQQQEEQTSGGQQENSDDSKDSSDNTFGIDNTPVFNTTPSTNVTEPPKSDDIPADTGSSTGGGISIINQSDIKLITSGSGIMVTAYGEYNDETSSIDLSWSSLTSDGTFTVQRLSSGDSYINIADVTGDDSYSYQITDNDNNLTFRIMQNTKDGFAVSNNVTMKNSNNKYSLIMIDSDKDGLYDYIESQIGTDPTIVDSDSDGINDYDEYVVTGTNPLLWDSDLDSIRDGDEDEDNDGLTTIKELKLGTSLTNADTDSDGLTDYEEVIFGTDPTVADTDYDGVNDAMEIILGTNPLIKDTNGDGILDGDEIFNYLGESDGDNAVQVNVSFDAPASQISSFEMQSLDDSVILNSDLPGYLGAAYSFTMNGKFDRALLTMTYPEEYLDDEDFEPAIYYYNASNETLEYVDGQTISGNAVTVTLSHFSTYVLLNKISVDEVWDTVIKGSATTPTIIDSNTIFVIDCSGSMSTNDQAGNRKTVVESFIDKSTDNDSFAAVLYETSSTVLPENGTMVKSREEKEQLKDSIYYYASGGTDISYGLKSALDVLEASAVTNSAINNIVLLTDGEDTTVSYNYDDLIDKSNKNNVQIYTVGLGNNINVSLLQKIAINTNASYYHASQSQDLFEQFENVFDDIDLNKDTDNDGLCDYYENHLRTSTGKILHTDINNIDTDGDGISDYDEVTPIYNDDGTVKYFKLKSNPTLSDSDNDGVWDKEDPSPLSAWSASSGIAKIVDTAGFRYLGGAGKDIIYSKYNPGQRNLGYCYAYDEGIVAIDSILQCENFYFVYDNKEWLIELWKGQYGIETGAEIGVYYRNLGGETFSQRLAANKKKIVKSISEQFLSNSESWLSNIILSGVDDLIEDVLGNYELIDSVSIISKHSNNIANKIAIANNIPIINHIIPDSLVKYVKKANDCITATVNFIQSLNSKIYDCVTDDDMISASFTLSDKRDKTIFERGTQPHWWLTGFKWGEYNEPSTLTMNVEFNFKDHAMQNAFITGGDYNKVLNYTPNLSDRNNDNNGRYGALNIIGSSRNLKYDNDCYVSYVFGASPVSAQPYTQTLMYAIVKEHTKLITTLYNLFKTVSGCPNNDPNKLDNSIQNLLAMLDGTGIHEAEKIVVYKTMKSVEYVYNYMNELYRKDQFIFKKDLPEQYNTALDTYMRTTLVSIYQDIENTVDSITGSLFIIAGAACS